MAEINRSRTIRPSSRLETSEPYKVDTKRVTENDILIVSVKHESESFIKKFTFSGEKVANLDSIHFKYIDGEFYWTPVEPD